jgi:asparagine synthase (glutamine-hydrolysing)
MCGIAGFILNKDNTFIGDKTIKVMTRVLRRRGPDSEGYWVSSNGKVQLGHRRLSIIELSDKGSQPMISNNGRFIITYNGEIYNHIEIRNRINKHTNYTWKSNSDTETILVSLETYGFEKTISSLQGMFAFGLIDKLEKKLYLVRDPSGEKPLYYGLVNENFIFGSELKSIIKFPLFKKKINMEALNYYLNFSFVPEPHSIFENINKLEKSSYLKFDIENQKIISIKRYYTVKSFNIEFSKNNYIDSIDKILNNSVKIAMTSDVEVGSFLSGGTDSSLISSIMNANSNYTIKTFSVGLDDPNYDESIYSRSIAKYLGTDHNEIIVKEKDLLDQTKDIADIYDEPFADSSQIPTSLISRFASKQVKVILSGDGADEYFGGYNRYIGIQKIENMLKFVPYKIRILLSKILSSTPKPLLDIIMNIMNNFFKSKISLTQIQEKIIKLAAILLNCKNQNEIYFFILKNYQVKEDNILYDKDLLNCKDDIELKIESMVDNKKNIIENMMYIDQNFYLQNDILQKVDRASMYYSLETRIPFLNTDLTNFALGIPTKMKIKNGNSKWILKEVLKKYIPEKYINRPKMGFSIPIHLWLRTSLRSWAENTLDYDVLKKHNLLNSEKIRNILNLHFEEKKNYGTQIWNLIILQKWLDKYY